jgi:hypothetical protein
MTARSDDAARISLKTSEAGRIKTSSPMSYLIANVLYELWQGLPPAIHAVLADLPQERRGYRRQAEHGAGASDSIVAETALVETGPSRPLMFGGTNGNNRDDR